MVVTPINEVGEYGSTWRNAFSGSSAYILRVIGYENLVRWNSEWIEVIPNVAESWEVSDDATTFTFRACYELQLGCRQ